MISFNQAYLQVQKLTSDSTANSLVLFKALINQTQNKLLALRKDITEDSATIATVALQQAYELPYNYGKTFAVTMTVGQIAYPLYSIEDDMLWLQINARAATYSTTIPSFYYIFKGQIQIYPKPSANDNTITVYFHKIVKDMTADDYTTGTITTLANGGTTVTGSGTTWTAQMVGRYLRITNDGYWYEIAAFNSTTSLTLKKTYQGTSISAGSAAYTIGEMPLIPEAYQEALIDRPVAVYWSQRKDTNLANMYWHMYDGGFEIGKSPKQGGIVAQFIEDRSSKVESAIVNSGMQDVRERALLTDPNAFPQNLTS